MSNSTWNTVYIFKNNAAALVYPTGLIISPIIKYGKPLYPDIFYTDFMGNTKKIKKWVNYL